MKKIEVSLCKDCYKHNLIVDNTVFMYVSSFRSKASHLKLKQAIFDHFDHEDISHARQTMEGNVKHLIPDFPQLGEKRTYSTNKSASDKMVDDVLDMFKSLDTVKDKDIH